MKLAILGTRGIPARHGGFETFAEHLALYLSDRGWAVTVYCHEDGRGPIREADWRGVRLIKAPALSQSALGSILYDWRCILHAAREGGPVLVLGYGTALFCLVFRLRGIPCLINMDGIEWRRAKWGPLARAWLYLNERLGCWLGNGLIADHPEIKAHLSSRVRADKITVIPYGADPVSKANAAALAPFGLIPGSYVLVVARPEPENSILEIVNAFSRRRRYLKLVVLGDYRPGQDAYHRRVRMASGEEVLFPGAVYRTEQMQALRYHARLYIHGHTVGGTNPSLVEALGAGSPVLAQNNRFNRWVAGPGARYFQGTDDCARILDSLLDDPDALAEMAEASRQRFRERFTWEAALHAYEEQALACVPIMACRARRLD